MSSTPGDAAAATTVVIVEDHEMVAEALRLALEGAGIRVLAITHRVGSVKQVVAMHQPDVVLMDYSLPDGDGISAVRLVREASPPTRIVMLTGSGDERVLVQAMNAGCAGYLRKDQPIGDLAAAVRAAHNGATLISPTTIHRLIQHLGGGTPWVGAELSAREVELLHLVAAGLANKQIAHDLGISLNTVRNHVQSVISKLGGHSKLEAVAIAQREGILRQAASAGGASASWPGDAPVRPHAFPQAGR